ncbi:MAG: LuxR C-terminal-related transcriptional regulator, partial [Anaerolineales bacterium]
VPVPRGDLVRRQRLIDLLQDDLLVERSFGRKLTVISAPAGYGKTTLISQWLTEAPCPISWLTLEKGESDPTRFLSYLMAAVQSTAPQLGASATAMLAAPQQPPMEKILTTLINDLTAYSEPLLLVLDDYHVIQSQPVHEMVNFLLEHLPTNIHLVITSREDPPLPLHRLQARRQSLGIRQSQLAFSSQEVLQFFKSTSDIRLSERQAAKLVRRTEGWVTGLQLAALSLRSAPNLDSFIESFTGSNRYIIDYLFEEVFDTQPDKVQRFLLQTAILNRICAELADAVTGGEESHNLLEQLEQANLFVVPMDQTRRWYRYHRLFADLLLNRLRATDRASEARLHARASQWFEEAGLITEAVEHALASEDWSRSATLIGQASDMFLKRGELLTLIDWFDKVPGALIYEYPDFGLSYAWALLLIGRFDEAEELLNHYESQAQATPELLGQVATAQAYSARARGDNKKVIEKSELALQLLPENELTSRSTLAMNLGLVYWHVGRLRDAVPVLNEARQKAEIVDNHYAGLTAQIFLARTQASQGSLHQAEKQLKKTLETGGDIPILVLSHYDLSCIYYEWNELGKAWTHLDQGLEMCTRSGNREFQNGGHVLKAYLYMAQGNILGALSEVETSHALSHGFGPATQARSMACHAEIALAMGDIETAANWVERMPERVGAHSLYRFIDLTPIRLLLAQDKKAAARETLSDLLDQATSAGWGYASVAIRALAVRAAESEAEAVELLSEALVLSEPEGFIRTYVEVGGSMIPILKEVARQGTLPDYVGKILDAYGTKGERTKLPLVEPLSDRELEVIRLLGAGLSNREIAEELVISIGTAKSHVHNICGKFGVRNRTEAAMRAKELDII